jgi:hypothetical protein
MSKARGDQLVASANLARKIDPSLARIYHARIVKRGTHHIKAVC